MSGIVSGVAPGNAGTANCPYDCQTARCQREEQMIMKITRAGTNSSRRGPADTFTGTVRLDPLFKADEPGRVAGSIVTFEPGARTAWHSHPAGQTLIVQHGLGRVQQEGEPVEEIRPGDVVWIPAGVRHWH